MRIALFALYLFLGATGMAHADIVFIDFNLGDGEIAAAKRAAEARHEKLIVIRNRMSDSDPVLSKEVINQKLDELQAMKINVSSLIVSGHDGNGSFFGEKGGQISSAEFTGILERHPRIRNSVRSLYLWGCYTATPGALDRNWKGILPNAALIAGFYGSAPSRTQNSNFTVLEDLLEKEQKIIQARDQQHLIDTYYSIRNINEVSAAATVCNEYLSRGKGVPFGEALKECQWSPEAERLMNDYSCYLDAQNARCIDVPQNTGSSSLRSLYNFEQLRTQCLHGGDSHFFGLPAPGALIRLIFFKNVWTNFTRNYGSSLAELDEALRAEGAPTEILFGDAGRLSRREVIKKLRALQRFLTEKLPRDSLGEPIQRGELFERLTQLIRGVSVIAGVSLANGNDSGDCIPFGWVDPDSREPSSCGAQLMGVKNSFRFIQTEKPVYAQFSKDFDLIEAKCAGWKKKLADANRRLSGRQPQDGLLRLYEQSRGDFRSLNEIQVRELSARIAVQERYRQSKLIQRAGWDQSEEGIAHQIYLNGLDSRRSAYEALIDHNGDLDRMGYGVGGTVPADGH